MKEKHMSFILAVVLAIVVIGGAVSYYSPDVCPTHQPDSTPPTIDFGGITQ